MSVNYELPGYALHEKLYESSLSAIFRGTDEKENNRPVVIKFYKTDISAKTTIDRIEREYRLLKKLVIQGVLGVYSLKNYGNFRVFVCEDFGAISLHDYLKTNKLGISEILDIAIRLTDIICGIRKNNVIHKNINPRNILINERTKEIRLIDFSIACQVRREIRSTVNVEKLEGTLAYISPEQTGRMNRTVDYRTDYYSLGVTLYEMLTGRLPFESKDPLELVHAHMAKLPVKPVEINPGIPVVISNIVMKLLSKNAEERYQSERGITHDLEKCFATLARDETIGDFALGEMDISETLQMPEKLYGRENELNILSEKIETASGPNAKPCMIFVSGAPGIGKSSLINEIRKPLVEKNGFFIQGKYDQFKRSMPFSAIIGAFSDLINQLLSVNEEALRNWEKKILSGVGENGTVIIDVIPQLKLIIGDQPAVPQLPPAESENRFSYAFENFTRVFASMEHPLVIFLDDLQWADSASMKWLKIIFNDIQLKNFLFIGAYRDNETTKGHPLTLFMEELKNVNTLWEEIKLGPLAERDIGQLLSETSHRDKEETRDLAGIIRTKTEGNPFFINEFIKTLYEYELIVFDNGWKWDIDNIKLAKITDNVVEFMAEKITKLPDTTRKAMEIASCAGMSFNLDNVAAVYGKSEEETLEAMKPAINAGMILKFESEIKFAHDRVREAVYGLLNDEERKSLHCKLGNALLKNTPKDRIDERVFTIVHQLNNAIDIITDDKERMVLAELNLMAGIKAKASTANEAARDFLNKGLSLLPENPWDSQYRLTLSLHTEGGEAEYLSGNHDEAEGLFNKVIVNAKDILDKVKVYNIKISLNTANNQLDTAFELGLKALSMMGMRMPKTANPAVIIKELIRAKVLVYKLTRGKNVESLLNLPKITDDKSIFIMQMLMHLGTIAYIYKPDYMPIMILKLCNYSLVNGNTAYSSFSYVAYGIILCGFMKNFDLGFEFGKLALKLDQLMDIKVVKSRVCFLFATLINHWKRPIRENFSYLESAYKMGLDTGELQYSAYSLNHILAQSILCGENLESVKEKGAISHELMKKMNQHDAFIILSMFNQIAINLSSVRPDKFLMAGPLFDEPVVLDEWEKTNNLFDLYFYTIYKMMIHFLYGDFKGCLELSVEGKKYIKSMIGMPYYKEFYYYQSLALLAEYPVSGRRKRKKVLRTVKSNLKKIKIWAKHCPENIAHKQLFMEAAFASRLGRTDDAMALYDKAADAARQNGFVNEEGMIYEYAGLFYRSIGREMIAVLYFQHAFGAFRKWGAIAKLDDMKEKYGNIFQYNDTDNSAGSSDDVAAIYDPSTVDSEQPFAKNNTSIDLNTVIKSATAISGEIVMDKLIDSLITIVMENAGAEKAVLLLKENENYVIEASGQINRSEIEKINSVSIENTRIVPETLIRYVARSGETVLMNNAFADGLFMRDDYIRRNKTRSVLCAPIMNKGNIIGIIYLENNLSDKVFTKDRLQIVNILSGQMGVSIDNARLYEQLAEYSKNLEAKVNERTNELRGANKKLMELDTLKNDFIANITHDFRSPLTVILSIADLAMRYNDSLNPDIRDKFGVIYKSSLRLKNTIDKLLDLAKIDARGLKLKIEKIELVALIGTVVDYYKSAVISSGIQILNVIQGREINDFYSDMEKLGEILDNILSNAVKFIDPNTGVITIDVMEDSGNVTIMISDNGIGIQKDKLDIIFDRFEQAHQGRNSTYRGTGIGLAFSRQLVEFLKGDIWAESEGEGKGSRFFIKLKKGKGHFVEKDIAGKSDPINKRTDIKTLIEAELNDKLRQENIVTIFSDLNKINESDYKKGIILIVDDDQNIREIIVQYLSNSGFKNFIIASDGMQGIDAVYEYGPDLIICDYNMPNMKGDDVHNRLVGNPKHREIPFIFLSAVTDEKLILERREVGAVAYLKKPIEERILTITVDEQLKKYYELKKITQIATIDELTGLNNRRTIMEHLTRELAIRKYRDISIIFFDVDNFKEINDGYGHQAGDLILSGIGTIVKQTIRRYDIAGRYGGDEFMIILPETNLDNAVHVAEIIRKEIMRQSIAYQGKGISVSSSFGISSLKNNAMHIAKAMDVEKLEDIYKIKSANKADWEAIEKKKERVSGILLKLADDAMYDAKKTKCRTCSYGSEKRNDFIDGQCPKCGGMKLDAGRNKVVGFGLSS